MYTRDMLVQSLGLHNVIAAVFKEMNKAYPNIFDARISAKGLSRRRGTGQFSESFTHFIIALLPNVRRKKYEGDPVAIYKLDHELNKRLAQLVVAHLCRSYIFVITPESTTCKQNNFLYETLGSSWLQIKKPQVWNSFKDPGNFFFDMHKKRKSQFRESLSRRKKPMLTMHQLPEDYKQCVDLSKSVDSHLLATNAELSIKPVVMQAINAGKHIILWDDSMKSGITTAWYTMYLNKLGVPLDKIHAISLVLEKAITQPRKNPV